MMCTGLPIEFSHQLSKMFQLPCKKIDNNLDLASNFFGREGIAGKFLDFMNGHSIRTICYDVFSVCATLNIVSFALTVSFNNWQCQGKGSKF